MYKSWTCICGQIFFLLSRGSGEMQTKNPEKMSLHKNWGFSTLVFRVRFLNG